MVTVVLKKLDENDNVLHQYTFTNFKLWTLDLGFPIVDVPLPQEDQTERILLKLMGNTSDTKFSWMVYDTEDGISVVLDAGGTPKLGISTVDKMIDFWRSTMRPKSIVDRFEFIINFPTPIIFKGTINQVKFHMTDGSPVALEGSFNFMEGKVNGGVFESDPPSPPNDVTSSSPGSGDLRMDWAASTDPGNGSINFWKFEYRIQGSASWTVISVASNDFDHTKTGLSADTYECRMRGNNIAGDGQPSPTLTQVVA